MVTLEDKFDIFYKIVHKAEEEKTKIALEELESSQKNMVENKIDELQERKEDLINKKKTQAISEKNEMISASIDKNRKKSLVKREELLEDLIQLLKIKAMEFTDSDEYGEYLINEIKMVLNAIDEEYLLLGLNKRDREKFEKGIRIVEKKILKEDRKSVV